jgi:hypothetical protein
VEPKSSVVTLGESNPALVATATLGPKIINSARYEIYFMRRSCASLYHRNCTPVSPIFSISPSESQHETLEGSEPPNGIRQP